MSEKRTLCQLLDQGDRVFVHLANETVWNHFLRQAASEGFEWRDHSNMAEKKVAGVVVIHSDMTVNYLTGQAGNILYQTGKELFRVDFARYINHSQNYTIGPRIGADKPVGDPIGIWPGEGEDMR